MNEASRAQYQPDPAMPFAIGTPNSEGATRLPSDRGWVFSLSGREPRSPKSCLATSLPIRRNLLLWASHDAGADMNERPELESGQTPLKTDIGSQPVPPRAVPLRAANVPTTP